jgi:hypothetical protein
MNDEYEQKLTEEDQDAVARVMLHAAYEALGELPSKTDDEDPADMSQRVLKAIAAAYRAMKSEATRLNKIHGAKGVYIHAEPSDVVASAFWCWAVDCVAIEEMEPKSVAGDRLLGFALGLSAARQFTEAMDMLLDGETWAFSGRGAALLGESDLARGLADASGKNDNSAQ